MNQELQDILDEAGFYAAEILKLGKTMSRENIEIAKRFQDLVNQPPKTAHVARMKFEKIYSELSIDMLMHILPQYRPNKKS